MQLYFGYFTYSLKFHMQNNNIIIIYNIVKVPITKKKNAS